MPNIIEQQDLLKGLPDNRLAMLMQNPTGDIPPFLVAAEAQRRQAIRAQFSGGPQESVVDTLTKQLSSVPENIQAPAQTPPRMPPPMQPQMGGVAGIQQGMRHGGVVQRYQAAGLVTPLPTRVQDIADQFGVSVDQAAEMLKNNPSLAGGAATPGLPFQINEQNQSPAAKPLELNLPSVTISPGELVNVRKEAAREAKYQEMDSYPGYGSATSPTREAIRTSPNSSMGMSFTPPVKTASPTNIPPDPDAGKQGTSVENQISAEQYRKRLEAIYGTSAEDSAFIKQKLEELYGGEEISNWEKAQKWFAAAQAAVQPNQTNTQAAINALAALGGGYADERATERADKRALQEALIKQEIADRQAMRQSRSDIEKGVLEFEVSEADRARATESATAERQLNAYKWQADQEIEIAKQHRGEADDLTAELNRHISDLKRDGMVDDQITSDPTVKSLTERINAANERAQRAILRARNYQKAFGGATGATTRVKIADGDTMGYLD